MVFFTKTIPFQKILRVTHIQVVVLSDSTLIAVTFVPDSTLDSSQNSARPWRCFL